MTDTVLSSLQGYAQLARPYDAMWDAATGAPRAHWQQLLTRLQSMGVPGINSRVAEAERLLHENGVGFDAGSNVEEYERRVAFDPFPTVVSADEWQRVSEGLRQRARLLDSVLRDIYGPRMLIKEGLLPAEIVFEHEGFQPACDGAIGAGLILYAADIAWDSQGRAQVVADRIEAPSGAGYALETRIICSRILPNAIRMLPVQRLSSFFQTLRETIRACAPHQQFNPRTVVLTRGPSDPGFFDHAYLASYLGYPLVLGQDLTVRERHLWLKTVDGLQLVDVVLRRLADASCDALELNTWEDAGVPGLLQVARSFQVVLANPLGAASVENAGLMPFLPAICQHLFGEPLKLASVESWWCGHSTSHVEANLDHLIVKAIAPQTKTYFGPQLSHAARAELIAAIRANPSNFVGQEILDGASTPGWVNDDVSPVRTVTRMFLVRKGNDFEVMPGGFSRTFDDSDFGLGLSSISRGRCKDTWVLAPESERSRIVWPATPPNRLFVAERESLPSRAAECLYWVGRYAERGEALARLAEVYWNESLVADEYKDPADLDCAKLLQRAIEERIGALGDDPNEWMHDLLVNKKRVNGLAWCNQELSRSANAVRDRWSTDTWRLLDEIHHELERYQIQQLIDGHAQSLFDSVLAKFSSLSGLFVETMTREVGWSFLMIGRRIERAFHLTKLLRLSLEDVTNDSATHQVLEAVLLAGESIITHRRRYRAYLAPETVVELLVLDEVNARSVAAAAEELKSLLDRLPRPRETNGRSVEERAMLELTTDLRLADAAALVTPVNDASGSRRQQLTDFFDHVEKLLDRTANAVELNYFAHVKARRLVPQANE